MSSTRQLPKPDARIVQVAGEPIPGCPTKTFYQYLLDLDRLARSQAETIAALEQRVYDLENP